MSAKAKEELLLVRFYILSSKNTDKVYIGSTTRPLYLRLAGHKCEAKRVKGCTSREIINAGDCSIDLLGEDECNWEERVKIENAFINGYGDQVVNYNTGRYSDLEYQKQLKKEYSDNHKEESKEYFKQRYQEHKEKISAKDKEIVECECGQSITKGNLPRHKKTKKHLDKLI